MTTWIENPEGGRGRGPRGVARAWIEVCVRPRRFFRAGVAPGDQAPGLTFAMAVVLIEEAARMALVPDAIPAVAGGPLVSAGLSIAVAVVLVAPVAIHLVAGLQTAILAVLTRDRGGVSETVQVIGYAIAPCAAAGPAIPELRALCAVYGAILLWIGLATVHDLRWWRAALAGAIPAAIVFGYGFRGFAAAATLLSRWHVI